MKDEVLEKMRNAYEEKKEEITTFNRKVNRIWELLEDSNVKEYAELIESIGGFPRKIVLDEIQEIRGIYNRFSSIINAGTTNEIYVYLGSFKLNPFSSVDDRLDYYSPCVDYRLYQDIEKISPVKVLVVDSEKFEEEHCIIKPKTYSKVTEYNRIKDEFIVESVKNGQDVAKKKILSRYLAK